MGKQDKGVKYSCRVREVSEEKLEKLYKHTNTQCCDCMFDCKNEVSINKECVNKETRPNINQIINWLKEENVNMLNLCNTYGLKLYILLDMLRGNLILNFKYYTAICDRLHMVKDGTQMNNEYQMLVRKAGVGIQ